MMLLLLGEELVGYSDGGGRPRGSFKTETEVTLWCLPGELHLGVK